MPAETLLRVDHQRLRRFIADLFSRRGVPREDADVAAGVLVHADLLGHESHGVARFANHPGYIAGLKRGIVNPVARPRLVSDTATTALLDGDAGLGGVVSTRAMELALAKAEAAGVGMVTVANSRHFGIASHYAMLALPRGMIGLAMTNAVPQVVATGSKHAIMGTNPISVAAPTGTERPFILDMATSVGAAGKLEVAQRLGKTMPDGWLVDQEGRPTTNPEVISTGGALLPLGSKPELASYKGYGLAVVVDILCGVLSGAGYSSILDGDKFSVGHFFMALRVESFRPLGAFQAMMDAMVRDLHQAELAPGYDRIYVHGEKELISEQERLANGIPLHPTVVESLQGLAREFEVPFPAQ